VEHCCVECFADECLRKFIAQSGAAGDCDFCGARGVPVLSPDGLKSACEPVIQVYEEELPERDVPRLRRRGKPLYEVLQDDWSVFSDAGIGSAEPLLAAVLGDPSRARQEAVGWRDGASGEWARELWQEFVALLTYRSRFAFPRIAASGLVQDDPAARVRCVLREAATERTLTVGDTVWRARRPGRAGLEAWVGPAGQDPHEWYGPPPPQHRAAGRANAEGIGVFYGALDDVTAAYEMQPIRDEHVWVADWHPKRDLRIADLTTHTSRFSPFERPDVGHGVRVAAFQNVVSGALAEPVRTRGHYTDYLATQYVAEVVRSWGFDGLLYSSAQREGGENIAVWWEGEPLMLGAQRQHIWVKRISYQGGQCDPERQVPFPVRPWP